MSCPKCGGELKVVGNGFFHGELFFCEKERKVFSVDVRDITKGAGEEFLKHCDEEMLWEKTRNMISVKNAAKAAELLKDL